VAYRRFRQRIAEAFRQDWLEVFAAAFGVICLIVGVFLAFMTVYAIIHNGSGADYSNAPAGEGFLKGTSWVAIGIFAAISLLAFVGGWGLVGKRVFHALRKRRSERESVSGTRPG
jgi:hypothetical protein